MTTPSSPARPFAITLATASSLENKTGAWRVERLRTATICPSARSTCQSASPVIHRSSWCTGAPLASWCQCGSRKSGPHLKTRTLRPSRVCSRASAATTVVLPWPEAGAATRKAGQDSFGAMITTPAPAWL